MEAGALRPWKCFDRNLEESRACYTLHGTMEMPEHSPAGLVIPETFVPLDIPVPQNAAAVFGYPGSASHVAFHWEPLGDELCYDDGRIAGTGEWYSFLQYRSHPHVAPALAAWNIGYSELDADHWLVLETDHGRAWIADIADAQAFLQSQHPPVSLLRMVDLPRVRKEMRMAMSRHASSVRDIRGMQRRQQERLRRLLDFCDLWSS